MPAQFGNIKIGGMQYGDVTIGEAMMNGQIVYRSASPKYQLHGADALTMRANLRAHCASLGVDHTVATSLPFIIDASGVTDLSSLFVQFVNLAEVDIINTGNVTNMTVMFASTKIVHAPVLDMSSVTSAAGMFQDCTALETVPALDLSKVANVEGVFNGCSSLVSVPDLDLASATKTYLMFGSCGLLTSTTVTNTRNVLDAQFMFYNCAKLTDGNARIIGRHPNVATLDMRYGSGLTRDPFQGAEGTITGRTLTNNTLTTLATRTITAAEGSNLKLLRMTLAWGNATATKSIRIDRNGVQVATATGQNPFATVEVACNVGDVITYRATVNSTTTANRVINSGTWGAWTR